MDPFLLEIYFAKHEFSAKYLLCCSDAESMDMKELLALADQECKALWDTCRLGYTETAGHPVLRRQIVEVAYHGLSADCVYCFSGAEEAIYATFRSLLTPGDEVVCVTPAYQSLFTIPEAIVIPGGGKVIKVDLEADWSLDVNKIESVITSGKTKMIIINFPHNPTGAVITKFQLAAIIELCKKHDLILFSDEVYRCQELDIEDRLPPAALLYDKAISLGVMSKSLGLAGLRIGWVCTQNIHLLEQISGYKHYLSICNSAPSEILAIIALRNQTLILDRNRKIMMENITTFNHFLNRHADLFEWVPPKGGCVGFVHYLGIIPLDELCQQLVEKHGVLLMPGSQIPGATGDFTEFFRLGFGRSTFPEALAKLENALAAIYK